MKTKIGGQAVLEGVIMKNSYNDIIKDLNSGHIKEIVFSVKDYAHYHNCVISFKEDFISSYSKIARIECKLVKDDSETVSFLPPFNEEYKLFRLGRKGSYSLKQIWNRVQIKQINY